MSANCLRRGEVCERLCEVIRMVDRWLTEYGCGLDNVDRYPVCRSLETQLAVFMKLKSIFGCGKCERR